MVMRGQENERQLARYGYAKHEIERISNKNTGNASVKFPGANSISFNDEHMRELNCRKTIVCEKTDGVRQFLCELIVVGANK